MFFFCRAFVDSNGFMFEKYDASVVGVPPGHGDGEYELQNGFGWTNGVLLDLLDKYGQVISAHDQELVQQSRTPGVYQWFVILVVMGGVMFLTYKRKNRIANFVIKDLKIQRMKVADSRRKR